MRNGFTAADPLRRGADWLARLAGLASPPGWLTTVTPTADIYFLNAMRDDLAAGAVQALGANVYGAHDRYVILRYASDRELARLEAARPRQVFYVIDDDFQALSRSGDLPAGYRARLARFVTRSLPRILNLTDVVLAPNALLFTRFPDHETGLVPPSYCTPSDSFAHFDDDGPLRLVFTGSRSHAGDLEVIAPALARICAARPELELTTFLGAALPDPLRRLGNVVSRPALPWAAYRRFMATATFHIALAPFRRTPTNECRSHNKVHDHAALGAAGLYGDILPYRDIISPGVDGLLLAPEPDIWFDALVQLLDDPAATRRLAEAGGALSRRTGDPALLRAFWRQRLGLESP